MAVVDVPVVTQHKFQQSFVVSVDVPQIPFIDRVVVISAASQRQARTVQIVVQFLDRLGHARLCATTGCMVQTVQKMWKYRKCSAGLGGRCSCFCSSSTRLDVPVISQ